MFLEISQNSPENTCARVSILIKLQASGPEEICEICEIFENTFYYRTSPVAASKSHRRGLSNFVSMPRLYTIQNTSNSLAKAHLRIRFSQNSSQWLLSNVSYFFKKGKNRNNFSYLLWSQYAWNLVIVSKLRSFSFMILKKLPESIFLFFQYKVRKTTLCLLFTFYIFL